MFRSCSKCGKVHPVGCKCNAIKREYRGGIERKLRNTTAWKYKSLEIRERANYLCEVCKDKGIYTYKGLEVHHIEKIRDNKDKLLDNYNLICLCTYHHKLADKGELEKSYLLELAKAREEDIPPGV